MFGLSFPEVAMIALVALLVLGPERLPAAARTAGALLRKARASWSSVKADIERELATDEVKRAVKQSADAGRELLREVDSGLRNVSEDVSRSATQAANALQASVAEPSPPAAPAPEQPR
jgi:sec-independent protein translocase protein TatB